VLGISLVPVLINICGMGKKKSKEKKFNLIDWMDQYIFRKKNIWWFILLFFCARMTQLHFIDKGLREHGVCTYALVINKLHSPRGGSFMAYRYYVPETNQYYIGKTGYKCSVGETIEVLYNPKRPQQSNAKEYIVKKKP